MIKKKNKYLAINCFESSVADNDLSFFSMKFSLVFEIWYNKHRKEFFKRKEIDVKKKIGKEKQNES